MMVSQNANASATGLPSRDSGEPRKGGHVHDIVAKTSELSLSKADQSERDLHSSRHPSNVISHDAKERTNDHRQQQQQQQKEDDYDYDRMSYEHNENEGDDVPLHEILDLQVFQDLLRIDDDQSFAKDIVYKYFDQAREIIHVLEDLLDSVKSQVAKAPLTDDVFKTISQKGHFLKGSSASIGAIKVRDSCERIQHLGQGLNSVGDSPIPDHTITYRLLANELDELRREFERIETYLTYFFEAESDDDSDEDDYDDHDDCCYYSDHDEGNGHSKRV
ncbi:Phosphorelay intermediate protein [Spiromyces aspiralis]|uniref:Phosphorelay intermediate protein n=1 Tax=Spiromyces aspiralis TaxID=68401 RepID=A0ACC1HVI1_9FUNG|nr:Phosphorelay intermediate protein [Spiromyces aspiralis]